MYTLYFDGLYKRVSKGFGGTSGAGFMCYGWLILQDRKIIAKGHGGFASGHNADSNVAEYLALIEGLEALVDLGIGGEKIAVVGDAKSVIEQMRGAAAVNSDRIRPLQRRAVRLAQRFTRLTWIWLPRRENRQADLLTRRAMKQIQARRSIFQVVMDSLAGRGTKEYRSNKLHSLLDLRVYQAVQV